MLTTLFAASAGIAAAQEPAPIPLFVVDLHGTTTAFPDDPQLAASRGLAQAELPGRGFGGDVAVHVFPFRYRAVTFGLGGRLTSIRLQRKSGCAVGTVDSAAGNRAIHVSRAAALVQLRHGVRVELLERRHRRVRRGRCRRWPPAGGAGQERLKTIDYGGGARWFASRTWPSASTSGSTRSIRVHRPMDSRRAAHETVRGRSGGIDQIGNSEERRVNWVIGWLGNSGNCCHAVKAVAEIACRLFDVAAARH